MIQVRRPQRWDTPFSEEMSEADVSRILTSTLFQQINPDNFNTALPLAGILANDARIVRLEPADVLVRKGEYGGSAFLTLQGDVCVIVGDFKAESLTDKKKSWFSFLSKNQEAQESATVLNFPLFNAAKAQQRLSLSTEFLAYLDKHAESCVTLDSSDFYGEIAALVRGSRQATLFAKTAVEVLEIRWQGLRDLMRYDVNLKTSIQNLYKERNLSVQLRHNSFFSHLSPAQLQAVSERSLFESYGQFDWQHSFKKVTDDLASKRLQAEPLIVKEGDYVDGLLLICSGFAYLSKKVNHGEKTIGYLKQGDFFGLEELAHHSGTGEPNTYQHTLRAIGYVDVIRIPTSMIKQYVFSYIDKKDLPSLFRTANPVIDEYVASYVDQKQLPSLLNEQDSFDHGLDTDILEQLVEQRFINGTSTMVIDKHRCTGCDDCVSACASLHDNQARFSRAGTDIGKYSVTHACMHCTDPVCLIGCPTGAIHRNIELGSIIVDDNTCIGCSGCATSCPYENIVMREVFNEKGEALLDEKGTPLLKASKCDLCMQHGSVPACEQACPHDALKRLDMGDIPSFVDWFNR